MNSDIFGYIIFLGMLTFNVVCLVIIGGGLISDYIKTIAPKRGD